MNDCACSQHRMKIGRRQTSCAIVRIQQPAQTTTYIPCRHMTSRPDVPGLAHGGAPASERRLRLRVHGMNAAVGRAALHRIAVVINLWHQQHSRLAQIRNTHMYSYTARRQGTYERDRLYSVGRNCVHEVREDDRHLHMSVQLYLRPSW